MTGSDRRDKTSTLTTAATVHRNSRRVHLNARRELAQTRGRNLIKQRMQTHDFPSAWTHPPGARDQVLPVAHSVGRDRHFVA